MNGSGSRAVVSETPVDVLIAGLDKAHRTQVDAAECVVKGIPPAQVHLAYAGLVTVSPGTKLDHPWQECDRGGAKPRRFESEADDRRVKCIFSSNA
jgi:hypothetical protein